MRRLLLLVATLPICAVTWRPIEPSEISLKTPKIDANADAEILYWEVKITDHLQPPDIWTVYRHYLRVKIFTEKGAKDLATAEIVSAGKQFVREVAARTIKPDGSIVEAGNDAIKDTDVLKGKKVSNLKVKAVAFPAVTPGSIIEYQYTHTYPDRVANYVHLEFSREYPVHFVKYLVKPIQSEYVPYKMRVMGFQANATPFTPERNGTETHYATTASNVPAFKEEANMPPENDVRPWLLIYYEEDKKLTPEKFWKEVGRDFARDFQKELKVDGNIKKTAAEVVSGAASDEEKIDKLLEFCRKNIKNVYSDSSGVTAEQRKNFKGNETTADTMKRKMGTGGDINALFVALAQAAGLEARLARIADRGYKGFDPQMMTAHFLVAASIAVKVNGNWRFYDPAAARAPKGFLRWQEEGTPALICDPKEPTFVTTPLNAPDRSRTTRRADLELDMDGNVKGKIRFAYSGHRATSRRLDLDQDSDSERERKVLEDLKEQYPGAEITDVKVENVTELDKPLIISASLVMRGYGQRTGKRMFVQPAFFQAGGKPLFGESQRKYPIHFRYPFSDVDRVSIKLPLDLTLDQPTAPGSFKIGETAEYKTSLAAGSGGQELIYTREFFFGNKDQIYFPTEAYPSLKKVFDHIHEQDGHTMTLKAAQ